ncbi:DUF397 domain-containing protein [Embleya sp. NPDC020630]|uniref:DUF397 domain-containing protein n=1 Tax=Embleya sp. NPDC020630 TaxID=3363979 RepID=UPI003797010A
MANAGVIAVGWRKSAHSGGAEKSCVESVLIDRHVGVRNSRIPVGPAHLFSPGAWASLVDAVKKPAPHEGPTRRGPFVIPAQGRGSA